MPPKRRAAAAPVAKAPTPRASKLAKENGINGAQEAEIKEAFALFQSPESTSKDQFMPTASVRRALAALNLSTSAGELRELLDAADPENEGIVSYEAFLSIAALQMSMKEKDGGDDEDDMDLDEEQGGNVRGGRGQKGEVEHAFRLFMGAKDGQPQTGQEVITMTMLKRVAKELKEDVSDEMLRNMLREASGGTRGVNLQEFENVMKRAGVFR